MSGQGTRYRSAGYKVPKPLIPVSGTPMIERLLGNFPTAWTTCFVLAENHRETALPPLLRRLRPSAKLHFIPVHNKGPGHAVSAGLDSIPENEPVLVSYCDYGMVWDAAAFERFVTTSECDACVVCYRGFHAHYLSDTLYAYCKMAGERVVEIREKGYFTDHREHEFASAGAYYFRSAKLLRQALQAQEQQALLTAGESYTSLTVQALLAMDAGAHVRVFEIPGFFQWGTPQDLQTFEYWERTFAAASRAVGQPRAQVGQRLLPMAGRGSRLARFFAQPKPLIPVRGRPMYRCALDTLPDADHTVFVALAEHNLAEANVVALSETPDGQALSAKMGLSLLKPNRDLVVSACDHGIVLDPKVWHTFRSDPRCDAAILTIRGYPGASRTPRAYAYVVPATESGPFPLVQRVSVKQPVSDTPEHDHVLVGTFWFASPRVMARGIAELERRQVRVNGELYLDSTFELLQECGLSVRMLPLAGYICWGDPNSLAETLYWQEIHLANIYPPRGRYASI
jgi:NDP-sugar pyrophosphorylase family protein